MHNDVETANLRQTELCLLYTSSMNLFPDSTSQISAVGDDVKG